jgi:hypothetical protein
VWRLPIQGMMGQMRIVISLLVAALLAASAAGATTRPRVALDGLAPVVVVGVGFEHATSVRVVVATDQMRLTKVVSSNANGSFQARWARALPLRRCTQVVVSAVSGERRAVAKTVVSCGTRRVPVQTP